MHEPEDPEALPVTFPVNAPLIPPEAVINPEAEIVVADTVPPWILDAVTAVAERPVHEPDDPVTFPVTFPVTPPDAVMRPAAVRACTEVAPVATVSPALAVWRPEETRVVHETAPPETFEAVTAVCARPVHEPAEPLTFPMRDPVIVVIEAAGANSVPTRVTLLALKLLAVTAPEKMDGAMTDPVRVAPAAVIRPDALTVPPTSRVNWGFVWWMPTLEEIDELVIFAKRLLSVARAPAREDSLIDMLLC